jgi:4-amino-4-deoxy-L-arabinose transferase-like glycosyltransferase
MQADPGPGIGKGQQIMNKIVTLVALFFLLLLVRLSSPVDLFEGDQAKQVGYVMDIVRNGDWLVQYETNGMIATKPPLYNWMAAIASMLTHSTAPWVMKLPSLLAGVGLLTLVYLIARKLFDESTAFWATAAFMASHHFIKLIWFARTDMLMVFGVYLAFWLLLDLRYSLYKSPLIGLLLGLNYLIKGPAGPSFFAVLLIIWAFHEQYLFKPRRWKPVLPGLLVFLVIAGSYLALLWNNQQFQSVVLSGEIKSRLPGLAEEYEPLYLYVGWLLGRIPPWPFVACAGLILSRRRPEWKSALSVASWALGIFIFLSVLPSKRHDFLLAVYPPIFMLAGLGMRYVADSPLVGVRKWAVWIAIALLVFSPAFMPFFMRHKWTVWVWLAAGGSFGCGVMAAISVREKLARALLWICAGLIIVNGLYNHGMGNTHPVGLYHKLSAFTARVRQHTDHERVLVWNTHPLISYELGLHEHFIKLEDLKSNRPKWLITEAKSTGEIQQATGWRLTEEAAPLLLPVKKVDAHLYRVD